jgi:2-polyprenyl-3-methyl-5-hydroxy-6-metoxy-1,4-benzoquinol methylase
MKEEEIRPRAVFEEYLRLAAEDATIYFRNSSRISIPCPACKTEGIQVFYKHDFSYDECPKCKTLFVNPRPQMEVFMEYYKYSASARYFATTFYKTTSEARREKLWKPKAHSVQSILKSLGSEEHSIIDIGGGYGIFAEEYKLAAGADVTIIEPGPELADICRKKGLAVIQNFLEEVKADQLNTSPKVFVSFELFEHLHDPTVFLKQLKSLMRPGDLFLFTTLSSMGLDIRVLWEQSNSVSLQHLQFFNPFSIKLLADALNLEVISVNTPGKLDFDILSRNRSKITDNFWRTFLEHSSAEDLDVWQSFIAAQGFSSHMWVVLRQP